MQEKFSYYLEKQKLLLDSGNNKYVNLKVKTIYLEDLDMPLDNLAIKLYKS